MSNEVTTEKIVAALRERANTSPTFDTLLNAAADQLEKTKPTKQGIVWMVPRCDCGYIFEDLVLKPVASPLEPFHYTMIFEPSRCPNCGMDIQHVNVLGKEALPDGSRRFARSYLRKEKE